MRLGSTPPEQPQPSRTLDRRLTASDNEDVAMVVREELARRRITRQQLAADAKISLSTLEKALSGKRPFTMATLVRLEEALGLCLREKPPSGDPTGPLGLANVVPGLAPEDHGSYARPAVSWIEGDYLTLRPSFGDRPAVYAYRTLVEWDETASRLSFRESDRVDDAFTQWGTVSIPHQSGHIYFVTNRHGQYRLIVVSRPTINGEMHGILTTLKAGPGAMLTPVATPIAFVPMDRGEDTAFGRIEAGHSAYDGYGALLRRTIDEPYALFLKA